MNLNDTEYLKLGQRFNHKKYGKLLLCYAGRCCDKSKLTIVGYKGGQAGYILVGPFSTDSVYNGNSSFAKDAIVSKGLCPEDFELLD